MGVSLALIGMVTLVLADVLGSKSNNGLFYLCVFIVKCVLFYIKHVEVCLCACGVGLLVLKGFVFTVNIGTDKR